MFKLITYYVPNNTNNFITYVVKLPKYLVKAYYVAQCVQRLSHGSGAVTPLHAYGVHTFLMLHGTALNPLHGDLATGIQYKRV